MALKDNLISYYKLEENAANTTVVDTHGTNTGTATTNTDGLTTSGKKDNGFDLVETNSESVDLGSQLLGGVSTFTISIWINADVTNSNDAIYAGWGAGASNSTVLVRINGDNLQAFLRQADQTQVGGTTQAFTTTGSWVNIVIKYDGSELATWVNGSKSGTTFSATGDINNAGNNEEIGQFGNDTAFFNGQVDEVAVWDRAITTTEISDIYNGGTGLFYDDFDAVAGNSQMMAANF